MVYFFAPYRSGRVGGGDHAQLGTGLLRKHEVVEFHHSPSKALLFPVEVAHCHLVDISANALKLGFSGENEGAWDMARPAHNINMVAIKNEDEGIFEETTSVFLPH